MNVPSVFHRLPKPTRAAVIYVGEYGTKAVLAGIVGILVARFLGPSQFGLLSYALSLFGITATLSSLEIRPILVRELAAGAEDRRTLVASALSRQLPAALALSVLATAVLVLTRGVSSDVFLLAAFLWPLPILALADTLRATLEVEGNTRLIVKTTLVAAGSSAGFRIAAILLDQPVWVFAAATPLEFLLVGIGLSRRWADRGVVDRVARSRSGSTARRLLGESWKLLIASIAILTFMRIDIVMLGILAGDRSAGVYTAAARLSELWYFIPMAAQAALRPRLAGLYAVGEVELYRKLTQRFITAGFATASFLALVTFLAASWVVPILFGPEFSDAAAVLRVHVVAAPFVFIGVASGQWLIDRRLTGHMLLQSIVGAAANVGLNLLLIPTYGAVGAAFATLGAYGLAAVGMNLMRSATRPLLKMQLGSLLLRWR